MVSEHASTGSHAPDAARPLAAIILAAGKGTRMGSDLPKVAHPVAGHPMIWWVVRAVRAVDAAPIILVVGHGADIVKDLFAGDDDDLCFVIQSEQLGTGHATGCAAEALAGFDGDVLVLAGDGPLIRPRTIELMRQRHLATQAAATPATAVVEEPAGYGRVVRDRDGGFDAIVEHKNASDAQRAICEIYPSYACFDRARLFEALRRLHPDPLTGEYYVTEVPALLKTAGHRVEVVDAVPPEDVLSINTPQQLSQVDTILVARQESMP